MKRGSSAEKLPTADLAPTGRAKCIRCEASIARGTVRVAVEREIDTGSFVTRGAGYLHPACVAGWVGEAWSAGLDDFVARVREHSSLDSLPAFSDDGAATTAKPASETPAFGALSGEQVEAIAARLAKLPETDEHKAAAVFEKAGVDWSDRDALRWHIAEHGLLPPTHPMLLRELADSVSRASPAALFAVLPKLAQGPRDHYLLMPGWSQRADVLVRRAVELDPERVAGILAGASKALRVGIQLARGRAGAQLEAPDRAAVLEGLATIEATGHGLPRSFGAEGPRLHVHGPDFTEPYRTAWDLARCFGTEAEWAAALAAAAKRGKFSELTYVLPGLAALPLADMITALGKAELHSGDALDASLRELVERRADDPAALAEAARRLKKDGPAQYVRGDLLVLAIGRMTAVPAGLEHEVEWPRFASHVTPWSGSAVQRESYRRALAALGRERSLALAEPIVAGKWGQAGALPLLAVHFDAALVRRLLALPDVSFQGAQFGPLGAPVLPALLEALAAGPDARRRAALEAGVRAVLGWIGHAGETFPAEHDRWLDCLPGQSYWSPEERGAFLGALRGMPEPRRIAALERLLAQVKQVERPFLGVATVEDAAFRGRAARTLVRRFQQVLDPHTLEAGLRALGPQALESFRPALLEEKPDPKIFEVLARIFDAGAVTAIRESAKVGVETPLARLLRLAAAGASGPTSRVYLIERPDRDKAAPKPRKGSYSRSGGKGPGLAGAGGEHVVTIDLEEVPELASRFPGARALALFVPDPHSGEDWDRATLVPVAPDIPAAKGGRALSLVAVDVPTAIFDARAAAKDPALKELRGLVFNRPGYVLGAPMYIQEDEGSDGFVMQLAGQIGDINLGDSGSLYVFTNYAFMQCF